MRLDLIKSPKSYKYREYEIFDFYSNIFNLGPTISIRSGTPLDSIRYHRFVYITRDRAFEQPQKIMVLPYLHERRIYLNRIMDNTTYFYTTIDTPKKLEEKYNSAVKSAVEKKLTKNSFEFEHAVKSLTQN